MMNLTKRLSTWQKKLYSFLVVFLFYCFVYFLIYIFFKQYISESYYVVHLFCYNSYYIVITLEQLFTFLPMPLAPIVRSYKVLFPLSELSELFLIQSKSCIGSWLQPHKSSVSKSQEEVGFLLRTKNQSQENDKIKYN